MPRACWFESSLGHQPIRIKTRYAKVWFKQLISEVIRTLWTLSLVQWLASIMGIDPVILAQTPRVKPRAIGV